MAWYGASARAQEQKLCKRKSKSFAFCFLQPSRNRGELAGERAKEAWSQSLSSGLCAALAAIAGLMQVDCRLSRLRHFKAANGKNCLASAR